jgi:hypothetical protein
MTHTQIRIALEGKLAALGAILVAWPGVSFTPPSSGLWYKPAILPGTVEAGMGVSADTHPMGDFQVSIFTVPGSGTSALHTAADALVAHFDRARLGSLQCGVPEIGPLIQEPDWLHLPVTVPYLAT